MSKIKIVTFNIRCQWSGDGINSFMHRAGFIYEKISAEMPDIIAFQECTPKIMELMEKMLPEYAFYGQYRSVNYWGEGLFVAVKKANWAVVAMENFWLSPTPYVAGSRFPGQSDCPRICNTVQVRRRESGEMMRIFNIHLDHVSEEARINGIKCVLGKMEEYSARLPLPTVLLGDFNAEPSSETVKCCGSNATPSVFDVTGDIVATNHDFGRRLPLSPSKIDYIFVTEELFEACSGASVWDECHEGIYLSDHYPVCAEFEY